MACIGLYLVYQYFNVCLNISNHQAIWVNYTQPIDEMDCEPRPSFKRDNPNELKSSDYTRSGFDRGHLVPNNDYGCSTFVMSNVVPQLPNFNRGAWKQSEEYIRKAYPLHQVIKGCLYKDIYKGILDIPIACWYKIYKNDILVEEKTLYQYV